MRDLSNKSSKHKKLQKRVPPVAYTVADVMRTVHTCCPPGLAYEWDNVGLQVGNPASQVSRILIALEADERTIARAEQLRCEMLIVHHPLIFRPVKSIRTDDSVTRRAMRLYVHNIALAVAHTNFDCAPLNMNRAMAEALKMEDLHPLEPRVAPVVESDFSDAQYKFVVFVPRQFLLAIVEAIHRGGGAALGNYTRATFSSSGNGSFMPGDEAHP